MEKTEVVAKIIEYVGGKDNVVNTWHCMTRLRFELKDTSKIQEDAIKALKKHYLKKPLLPSTFSKANHLQEIKGVYVPFWMYDGKASGSVRFHATTVHKYTSGDYEVTEISHYDVRRAGSVSFEKIPVDASSKMPDDYMDSIEPYDYAELKPFSTAYLPGFLADKYDVSVEDSRDRADRGRTSAAQARW